MSKYFYALFLLFLQVYASSAAEKLYSKSFGEETNPAIIFLHGGPGYNSASFEFCTATTLSERGFYVIVYDRRGEGRSIDSKAEFSFEESISDLNRLYKKHKLKKAALVGHSFGGMLGTKFAEKYPEKVSTLYLVGAPLDLQESFKHIIRTCEIIYKEKDDQINLSYIKMLQKMDTTSIAYSSYCFAHAMQNGFYSSDSLTPTARLNYKYFSSNLELKKHSAHMTIDAPQGFWKNEKYTTLNLAEDIKNLKGKCNIIGIYGMEDGLYSMEQIVNLKTLIGDESVHYLSNCSHSSFIDRPNAFIKILKSNSN